MMQPSQSCGRISNTLSSHSPTQHNYGTSYTQINHNHNHIHHHSHFNPTSSDMTHAANPPVPVIINTQSTPNPSYCTTSDQTQVGNLYHSNHNQPVHLAGNPNGTHSSHSQSHYNHGHNGGHNVNHKQSINVSQQQLHGQYGTTNSSAHGHQGHGQYASQPQAQYVMTANTSTTNYPTPPLSNVNAPSTPSKAIHFKPPSADTFAQPQPQKPAKAHLVNVSDHGHPFAQCNIGGPLRAPSPIGLDTLQSPSKSLSQSKSVSMAPSDSVNRSHSHSHSVHGRRRRSHSPNKHNRNIMVHNNHHNTSTLVMQQGSGVGHHSQPHHQSMDANSHSNRHSNLNSNSNPNSSRFHSSGMDGNHGNHAMNTQNSMHPMNAMNTNHRKRGRDVFEGHNQSTLQQPATLQQSASSHNPGHYKSISFGPHTKRRKTTNRGSNGLNLTSNPTNPTSRDMASLHQQQQQQQQQQYQYQQSLQPVLSGYSNPSYLQHQGQGQAQTVQVINANVTNVHGQYLQSTAMNVNGLNAGNGINGMNGVSTLSGQYPASFQQQQQPQRRTVRVPNGLQDSQSFRKSNSLNVNATNSNLNNTNTNTTNNSNVNQQSTSRSLYSSQLPYPYQTAGRTVSNNSNPYHLHRNGNSDSSSSGNSGSGDDVLTIAVPSKLVRAPSHPMGSIANFGASAPVNAATIGNTVTATIAGAVPTSLRPTFVSVGTHGNNGRTSSSSNAASGSGSGSSRSKLPRSNSNSSTSNESKTIISNKLCFESKNAYDALKISSTVSSTLTPSPGNLPTPQAPTFVAANPNPHQSARTSFLPPALMSMPSITTTAVNTGTQSDATNNQQMVIATNNRTPQSVIYGTNNLGQTVMVSPNPNVHGASQPAAAVYSANYAQNVMVPVNAVNAINTMNTMNTMNSLQSQGQMHAQGVGQQVMTAQNQQQQGQQQYAYYYYATQPHAQSNNEMMAQQHLCRQQLQQQLFKQNLIQSKLYENATKKAGAGMNDLVAHRNHNQNQQQRKEPKGKKGKNGRNQENDLNPERLPEPDPEPEPEPSPPPKVIELVDTLTVFGNDKERVNAFRSKRRAFADSMGWKDGENNNGDFSVDDKELESIFADLPPFPVTFEEVFPRPDPSTADNEDDIEMDNDTNTNTNTNVDGMESLEVKHDQSLNALALNALYDFNPLELVHPEITKLRVVIQGDAQNGYHDDEDNDQRISVINDHDARNDTNYLPLFTASLIGSVVHESGPKSLVIPPKAFTPYNEYNFTYEMSKRAPTHNKLEIKLPVIIQKAVQRLVNRQRMETLHLTPYYLPEFSSNPWTVALAQREAEMMMMEAAEAAAKDENGTYRESTVDTVGTKGTAVSSTIQTAEAIATKEAMDAAKPDYALNPENYTKRQLDHPECIWEDAVNPHFPNDRKKDFKFLIYVPGADIGHTLRNDEIAGENKRECTLCKKVDVECTGILDRLKECEARIWACSPCKNMFRIALRKNKRTNTYRLRDAKNKKSDGEDDEEYNVLDDVNDMKRHNKYSNKLKRQKTSSKSTKMKSKRSIKTLKGMKGIKGMKGMKGKQSEMKTKKRVSKKRKFCEVITTFDPMIYSVRGNRGHYVFREFDRGDLDYLHTLDIKMTSALMGNTNDCYGREWLDKVTNPERTVNHRWRTITCCKLLDQSDVDKREEIEAEQRKQDEIAKERARNAEITANQNQNKNGNHHNNLMSTTNQREDTPKSESMKASSSNSSSSSSSPRKRHLVPFEFGDGRSEWIKHEESEPVAFAMYKQHRCASDLNKRYCELFWILVDTEHQRRGIASRLIDIMMAEAGRESAISEFRLHVLTDNDAAVPLYKRLGFKKRQLKVGYPKAGHSSYRCVNAL